MNKFFTKIAGLTLGLAMAIGVGVAIGGKSSDPVTTRAASLIKTYDLSQEVPADLTATGTPGKDQNDRGMGVAKETWTLTTTASYTDVEKIVVNAASNGTLSNMSLSITVGGNSFGSAQTLTASANTNYTFESTAKSGVIVVSANNTQGSKTIWIKTIEVYASSGGGGGGATYTLVTNASDLVAGTTFILLHKENNIAAGSYGNSVLATTSATVSGSTATSDGATVFTLGGNATNGWTFKFGNNYLGKGGSGNANLSSNATLNDGCYWTISIANNLATMKTSLSGNRAISYNYNNGSDRFAGYTPSDTYTLPRMFAIIPQTYTVTFNANGHGTAPSSQKVADGGYASEPTAPTATGYDFGGWYKEESCTNAWNFTSDKVTANTTLYAKWTTHSYTITWKNYDGSTLTTTNVNYNVVPTYSGSTPTKPQDVQYTYSFSGWDPTPVVATADTSYTAQFTSTLRQYTVGGGTIDNGSITSATVNYGTSATVTLSAVDGYRLPLALGTVTMGGQAYAGYTYNSSNGQITVPSVEGEVVINATCPLDVATHTISGLITNGSLTGQTGEQVEGGNYTVQVSPSALYKYPTSVTVTGAVDTGWSYNSSNGTVTITNLSENITISASCPDASITAISVSGQKEAFTLGDPFSFEGTVYANYDDIAGTTDSPISTDLVSFDSSDYNPFVEANSSTQAKQNYTIGVSLKADSSITTSYTVTVTKKTLPTVITYNLVTKSKTDWSGVYVIMSNNGNDTYTNTLGTTTNNSRVQNGASAPAVSQGVIASATAKQTWTISKNGDYYNIKNNGTGSDAGEGKYLAGTGKNNAGFVADKDDNSALWTITYTNSTFSIHNKARAESQTSDNSYLRNNGDNGWAAYQSGTGAGPALFEKIESKQGAPKLIQISVAPVTGKYEQEPLTAEDFITTAHYDTGSDYDKTVTPTITSGPEKLSVGSNLFTLSYTEGDVTKSCEVNVIAQEIVAVLDGIVWSQEGESRTIFDDSELGSFGTLQKHYDNDATVALDVADCSVAVYTKSNDTYTKAHDIASPSTYTWDLTNDNGKYLGVTYTEDDKLFTKYSGVINVVEKIGPVVDKIESWIIGQNKVTSLSDGATVVMVAAGWDYELSSVDSYGAVTSYSTSPAGTYILTVEQVSNNVYAFKDSNNKYLRWSSGNSLNLSDANIDVSEDPNSTWAVTFDGTKAKLVNQGKLDEGRSLAFNNSSNPKRIANYKDTTITGEQTKDNYSYVSFYSATKTYIPDPSGEDVSNTNAVVQKAVLDFAASFNETMACVNAGTTANISSKWSSLATAFTNAMNAFTEGNLDHFKALFAGADAVDGGDSLQDMLARYKYILNKYNALGYELDDFLADIGRPPVSQAIVNNPFAINMKNASATIIVVVISAISAAAIGGYFLFRKKKED